MTKAEKARVASKPRFSEEERIHKYQETAIKKFDEKIAKAEEVVAAIYENYPFIAQVISSLDAASKRLSWQEIEHHLRNTTTTDAKRIVALHPDEAAVEIDIGKKVKIFVHESVEQNAGRYYDLIKKFKKKKEGALLAMKTVRPKKKVIRRDLVPMKNSGTQVPVVCNERWCCRAGGTGRIAERGTGQEVHDRGRSLYPRGCTWRERCDCQG